MEITGQCKEDFEKWYFTEKANKSVMLYSKREFLDLTPSMQYGVYVDFFNENKMYIYIKPFEDLYSIYIDWQGHHLFTEYQHEKTLSEAREQAITKANELYNARTTL